MFYMVFRALQYDLTTTLQNLHEQESQNCVLCTGLYFQPQIVDSETSLPWIRISPLKNEDDSFRSYTS